MSAEERSIDPAGVGEPSGTDEQPDETEQLREEIAETRE